MKYKDFGAMISEARKSKNISQEELAEKLNVTRQAISNWENNKCSPDISIISKLCNTLDINIYEFFDNKKGEKIIELEKNKIRSKNIVTLICTSILVIALIILSVIIISKNKFNYFTITIDQNDYFELNNAHYIETKDTYYLNLGSLSHNIKGNIIVSLIKQKENEQIIIYSTSNLKEMIIHEKKGYNEYFNEFNPAKDELYIKFTYTLNNEKINDIYKLNFKKTISTPKIINLKNRPIGTEKEEIKIINPFKKEVLLNNGYKFNTNSGHYEKVKDNKYYYVLGGSHSLVISYTENNFDYDIEYNSYMDFIIIHEYDKNKEEFTIESTYFYSNNSIIHHKNKTNIEKYLNLAKEELNKLGIKATK